jgi:hypothetical protein
MRRRKGSPYSCLLNSSGVDQHQRRNKKVNFIQRCRVEKEEKKMWGWEVISHQGRTCGDS